MRVARVCAHRDLRCGVADEPLVLEPSDHLLLDVVLRRSRTVAKTPCYRIERAILDPIERVRRGLVRGKLSRRPRGFELLHEVA